MAVLGVDLGGTWIRLGVSASLPEMSLVHKLPRSQFDFPLPLEALCGEVEVFLRTAERTGFSIEALGVSVAGVVEPETGFVTRGENLGWREIPLGETFKRHFHLPVSVDTDVFCGAWAEHRVGNAKDLQSFLYVAAGTGIGHALICQGRLWRGARQAANVFGHLKVIPGGRLCYCGQRGCLCQYFSGQVLSQEEFTPEERQERWTQFTIAVSHALNLLDLEGVVLSGGVFSHFDFRLEDLARTLQENVYPEIRPIAVRKGALGEHSQLVGAMLQAIENCREGGTKP